MAHDIAETLEDAGPDVPLVGMGAGRPPAEPPAAKVLDQRVLIPLWTALSAALILSNKHILTSFEFTYPVSLAAFHMTVTALGARLLRLAPGYTGSSSLAVTRKVAPFAVLVAASLVLNNEAYMHLDIDFVQMLKVAVPMITLVLRLALGVQAYNHLFPVSIAMASVGCIIVFLSGAQSSVPGILCLVGAILLDTGRLVICQLLLEDPEIHASSVAEMVAPIAALLLGILFPVFEGIMPLEHLAAVGFGTLVLNGALAVGLNIASAHLIDATRTGALVPSLVSSLRDGIVIIVSMLLGTASVSLSQFLGYDLAVAGLLLWYLYADGSLAFIGRSLARHAESRIPANAVSRRVAYIGAAVVLAVIATSIALRSYEFDVDDTYTRQIKYPLGPIGQKAPNDRPFLTYVQTGGGMQVIPPFDDSIDVRRLPKVAWVVVATAGAIDTYANELAHLSCYCTRLGIPFYVETSLAMPNHNFMSARHRAVAKYLRYFQWVVFTDADTIVLDSRRDPREYFENAPGVDVMFPDRDNGEVCACAYMIRNSPGGWSFLRRWVAWGDGGPRMNRDNGNLVEMVAAGLTGGIPNNANDTGRYRDHAEFEALDGPDRLVNGPEMCLNNGRNWGEYAQTVECFDRTLAPYRYSNDHVPYYDIDLWAWSTSLPPVRYRAYKINSGFWRNSEGVTNKSPFWYDKGMEGDFMGGGKHLALLTDEHSILCSGEEWRYPSRMMTLEETRTAFKEHKITWWPGCFDAAGVNHCKETAVAEAVTTEPPARRIG